ncbi:MAG: hypothetical protein AB1656_06170 [Candidatus Omnitrophota bacterium]
MNNYKLRWPFLILFLSLIHLAHAAPKVYVYQVGAYDYSNSQEIVLDIYDRNQCEGNLLCVNTNYKKALLKFSGLTVPAGKYKVELLLTCKQYISSGTLYLYQFKEFRWDDPGAAYNPPPEGTYATWNFRNYSSASWQAVGGEGSTEMGALIAQFPISGAVNISASFNAEYAQEVTALGFALKGDASIVFYEKDTAGTTQDKNPKLILTENRSMLGGLDWNRFFRLFRLMR